MLFSLQSTGGGNTKHTGQTGNGKPARKNKQATGFMPWPGAGVIRVLL
jgi:hypothetical protein